MKTPLLMITIVASSLLAAACASAAPSPGSPGAQSVSAGDQLSQGPAPRNPPPIPFVSITLSPVAPAGADALAASARLLRQRAARLRLQYTEVRVSGQGVVLTGPADDEAQLKTLAAAGVLTMRQVLFAGPATSSRASGSARLVHSDVLALFHKLTCTPGDTVNWKSAVGYTNPAFYDNPNAQIVACGYNGQQWGRYALDVAEVQGNQITSAAAALTVSGGQWQVTLTLNSQGAAAFGALTSRLYNKYYPGSQAGDENDIVLDQVAIVVDGNVVTAPAIEGAIAGGGVQISGNFTAAQAQELAAQLQGGPLPVEFRISAISVSGPSASVRALSG